MKYFIINTTIFLVVLLLLLIFIFGINTNSLSISLERDYDQNFFKKKDTFQNLLIKMRISILCWVVQQWRMELYQTL